MAARGAGGDDDGSTPLFFFLALLVCVVAPWTFAVAWAVIFPGRYQVSLLFPETIEDGSRVRFPQTQAMVARREAESKRLYSRRSMLTKGFICRCTVLLILWCWLAYIILQLQRVMATSSLYANFDPYELLGVSRAVSNSEIKKAFRKMSLKYHPDKNPGPTAADKFMLVKKAYDALTDPVAKRNYALYGNPDGPTKMELSVAIPTFSKERQKPVLILLMASVLGVPLSIICCCMGGSEGEKCGNGVFRETMEALKAALTEKLDVQAAQALLLASRESAACRVRQEEAEREALEKLIAEVRPKAAKGGQEVRKVEALFLAHVQRRHALLTEALRKDLDELLPQWAIVAMALANLACEEGYADSMLAAVELYRCIVQALEPGASNTGANPLLQVPHMDVERLKQWRKGPKKGPADLPAFAALTADERRAGLQALGYTAQELLDAEEFAKAVPRVTVEASVVVEGEENVCKDDVATLTVKFTRENLERGEASGAAHTPFFPSAAVPEAWWFLFTLPGKHKKTRFARLMTRKRESGVQLKFVVPNVGKLRCPLLVTCEAYAGLTIETQVTFQAQAPQEEKHGGEDGEEEEEE